MFTTEKTTQAAAYLLKRSEGTLHYAALLKMLYLSDKKVLLKWGAPLTYDKWVAMPMGPVLSRTYELISAPQPESSYWGQHIRTVGFDLELVAEPGDDLLSEAEEEIMASVFAEFIDARWKSNIEITQAVPKGKDVEGASHPITYRRVLEDEGFPFELIDQIIDNIEASTFIEESLSMIDTRLCEPAVMAS